jgi:hypothetical protein
MGGEGMGLWVVAPIGVFSLIWLIVRCFSPTARPFALPTLLASLLATFVVSARMGPGSIWVDLFAAFGIAAVIFGLHAHAIKWLIARRG